MNRIWFSVLAVGAGVLAAAVAIDAAPGINVVVIASLMGMAVLIYARDRLSVSDLALASTGFVFIVMFAVRTSEWVLFADLCGAAGLASLAMHGGKTWGDVIRGGVAVLGRLPRSLGPILKPLRDSWRGLDRIAKAPLLRGSVVGLVLAAVFTLLFASADQAFAHVAHDLFIPNWQLDLLPARVFVALVTICFTGAYASLATVPSSGRLGMVWAAGPGAAAERVKWQKAEWTIPLGLLNLVFAGFVAVQLAVLFGGREHVLRTAGLTYAEYARSGFFQLVVIAALVLAVIAIAVRFADVSNARDGSLLKGLLGCLCVLTLVVLVSALKRLGLYEHTFGFTMLRFFVHVTIFWLGLVFVAVMVAGATSRSSWLPRTLVWMTAAMLLGVNLMNPEAFIARRNIERYEATGKIDVGYLASLSADAVPTLAAAGVTACLAQDIAGRIDNGSFWAFNLSRTLALDLPPSTTLRDCST
ncbi:MAG: hypothetical protein QOG04_1448 [Actinomycetota bacterium]|nr:hypothetical protein [Actinomycetota bacterium]